MLPGAATSRAPDADARARRRDTRRYRFSASNAFFAAASSAICALATFG